MTIAIGENLSLLASLLRGSPENSGTSDVSQNDGNFAGKLDSILAGTNPDGMTEQTQAVSLAETLNLQMLRATLALAGDDAASPPLQPVFSNLPPSLQALVRAYSTNQPEQANIILPTETDQAAVETYASAPKTESNPSPGGSSWLDPVIAKASRKYGVEVGLIKAVIKAESNFNPTAVSHAGARGLMQLMPATARSLGVNDSFDPEQNVMAGTRFLSDLLKRYNGDIDSALAAYNWGPGNVDKRPDRLPRETRDYLVRVKQLYSTYSA